MLQRRKNWSGFRIFWGYKQVAWAIHRSSDSRWTYLPQAHNPGIICIERSKKLRKVRLSDGCSSSNVRALRYGSLKEYRGRCSFWPLWGLRAPSHSLESVQFFLLPMISAARLRSFLAPPSRPTYAVLKLRARYSRRGQILRDVRHPARAPLCELRKPTFADCQILPRVRPPHGRGSVAVTFHLSRDL